MNEETQLSDENLDALEAAVREHLGAWPGFMDLDAWVSAFDPPTVLKLIAAARTQPRLGQDVVERVRAYVDVREGELQPHDGAVLRVYGKTPDGISRADVFTADLRALLAALTVSRRGEEGDYGLPEAASTADAATVSPSVAGSPAGHEVGQ